MPSLAGIQLLDSKSCSVGSALAVQLSAPARASEMHNFADWEVDLRSGYNYAVARSRRHLAGSALVDDGMDMIRRALDLASITSVDHLVTLGAADNHIAVERTGDGILLRLRSITGLCIGTGFNMTTMRSGETAELNHPPPSAPWMTAFRFFRLSQESRDLFDACRNLYLGMEALLDKIFPKERSEDEKTWILRALRGANAKCDFSAIPLKGRVVPLDALVDRLHDIRVHVFNAKSGRVGISEKRANYLEVAEAYSAVLEIWIELLRGWVPTSQGSGLVAYADFKFVVENTYAGAVVAVGQAMPGTNRREHEATTADDWAILDSPAEIVELRPGRAAVIARSAVQALRTTQSINRLAIMNSAYVPMITGSFPDLTLEEVDQVEVIAEIRLVDPGQARPEFS